MDNHRAVKVGIERSPQGWLGVVGGDEGVADAAQQHEPDSASLDLLIDAHVVQRFGRSDALDMRRQAGALEQPLQAPDVLSADQPAFLRHRGRHQQACPDGFAMQPLRIAGSSLYGMTEGMPEIQ